MERLRLLKHAELGEDIYRRLEAGLLEAFPNLKVVFDQKAPSMPSSCLNRSRGQYNSTMFLEFLRSRVMREDERVLAVESVDLYAGHLNFVFGEADPEAGVAVVSTYRLRPEFYGEVPDLKLFVGRLIKEAVHEVGHTFWLGHCSDRLCVMSFSNSIRDTDIKSPSLCQVCRSKLSLKGIC